MNINAMFEMGIAAPHLSLWDRSLCKHLTGIPLYPDRLWEYLIELVTVEGLLDRAYIPNLKNM